MDETLLYPLFKDGDLEGVGGEKLFISYLNLIEGWKTKAKNLHWSAPKKNIHVYLDAFLDEISEFQDAIAEGFMGILGKMQPNAIKAVPCDCLNAIDLINEVKEGTLSFYENLPQEPIYKGICGETEAFIQEINKYKYLFSLCDIDRY